MLGLHGGLLLGSGGGGGASCPTITSFTDQVLFDHAVDGDQTEIVLQGANTRRTLLFIRDVTFASADRLGVYVSEDCGVTKEQSAAEYEGYTPLSLTLPTTLGASLSFTAAFVAATAATTGNQDGVVEIVGMGSQGLRTAFKTFAGDGSSVQMRRYWRGIAREENGLIIASLGGNPMKSGQIVARTYPGNETIELALSSMWVGAVT